MERGKESEIGKKEEKITAGSGIIQHRAPNELWGPAVEYVRVDSIGRMWAGNGEYETQINYCPFSGVKARVQMRFETKNLADGKSYKEYIND